jgi:hypothetical protein
MPSFKIIYRKIILISTIIFLFTSSIMVMATNTVAEDGELIITEPAPLKVSGYHTYAETNATLYSIEENYTSIAKVYNLSAMFPHPNGVKKTTWEGRDILAIKISDNPELNETDEPNVLYMGTHHAREVIANELMLYFLKSLVENYTINQTITDIINTREIWIVPIVNPDGVEYFQYNNFNWRKNRRDNGDGSYGVDLNRNYGYMWGLNDVGSNPATNHPNYRGPYPFSEPETQIIRDFGHKYDFKMLLTGHSSGELILYPWGHKVDDTPDEYLFEAIGNEMAKYNGYTVQQGIDLYPVNGETTDWFYENFTTLGYTLELSTSQVPPANAIPSVIVPNYEPCVILAKIADDPFKIFKCGISGKITDKQSVPLEGAKVNTTFLGQEIFQITNSTGEYKLILPPNQFYTIKATKAGYAPVTQSNVPVNTDQYTVRNIKLKDIVPPEISAVTSSVGLDSDNNYEVGSIVRINVSELNDEIGLTGVVNITSVSNSYISGDIDLVYNSTTKSYIYLWNTSGLLPGDDYVIEANLTDFDQNYDGNGSNNTGPDLVLKFTDDTPPVISIVDSFVGTDNDEVYETNSVVRIKVVEKLGEVGLSGTVFINSSNSEIIYISGTISLNYDDVNGYYYWDWDTSELQPGDFWVETTLRDPSDNVDLDGLPQTPDLVITLQDTISPEIINLSAFAIDPFGDKDTDGRYEIQSVIYFTVIEKYNESWLDGKISINSLSASYSLTSQPLVFDNITNEYRFTWNTTGLSPATDYLVETSLTDSSMNSDNDGFNNTGPDMIIVLQDSIPPKVQSVDSYVVKGLWGAPGDESDNNEVYELGTVVRFLVYEELNDPTLLGTVRVYSISQSYDTGHKQMSFDGDGQVYYWDWNTSGLQVTDDYKVDATLQDSWGNKDSDGSVPGGPDLVVKLHDTTPPVIISVSSIVVDTGDTGGIYEAGNVIQIIITDRHNEIGLYGTVRITLNSTGYDSGLMDISPSSTNLTYYYDWDTSGNSIGPGIYSVETTLVDSFNNSDSDGLALSPDLAIELVDNIPPDPVKNVNVQENLNEPGEVEITWDSAEPGATVYIYRSKSPLDEENITQMAPIYISTLNESSYIDNVPSDGSTYYYALICEDSEGNINWNLTEDNTGSVQVGKPKSDKGSEDTSFKIGEMGWIILIIIIIVIIVILVAVFLYTRKPRQQPPASEPEAWGDGEYEEQPPPPPKPRRKGSSRRGRKKAKTGKKRGTDWDETEEPPEMQEFELEPLQEAPLHVKPGGKAKKYEKKELDDVRAALWEDMQDEFGVTPGFVPEGAQDYDYDEAQEYTEYDDFDVKPTGKSTPTEDAAVDIFSEDEDKPQKEKDKDEDEDEDEDEEVFEVEFDDEDEEEEFAEDDDIDWE